MVRFASLIFGMAAMATPVGANAQSTGYLVCTFSSGVVTDLTTPPATEPMEGAPLMLIFRDIDMAAGTATVVGNANPDGVQTTAIEGINSFSFVETTPSGNVNSTSVFPADGSVIAPAVTSRHVAIPGGVPVISQLFGSCRRG